MHVHIVAQYFWPETVGAGVWIRELAADLAQKGHRVTVITGFPNYPQGRVFEGYRHRLWMREELDGVEVIRTGLFTSPRRAFWSRALSFGSFCASAPWGTWRAARPDVVYAILPPLPLGWTIQRVPGRKRVPVVVNVQDIYPDIAVSLGYLRNRAAIQFFRWMERSIYARAATVVVITDSFCRNLVKKGVPAEKIQVVPNWVDSQAIRPGPKDNAFRQQWGVNGNFLVVYSGGMGHNTSLPALLQAARLLRAEPFRFVLIGDGAHRKTLEETAAGQGISNVRFLPFQPWEAYPQVLAASDLQVVSLNESATAYSLPSKMLKIMSSGRPVLALARPESDVAKLVGEAGCGVVADPKDPQELADALRGLSGRRETLEQMGARGRTYLVEHFERARCVDAIESVLLRASRAYAN